ncbi:cytochrome P450 [Pseudovirgaria hyperparasitica]|uniref:Cytochrome P450 n=1 Tax=Pseudovirgaria hyperparasitica TaxID=470096 RepID=A0A6A6VS76_9PEZI|nr:cytochrome P450 [Pseudovirgaria hyperparasitica]KAF2753073.1 cytochrome P450 [Pseudovirgaria hyperparasitica]
MFSYINIVLLIVIVQAIRTLYFFYEFVQKAKATGLPYTYSPVIELQTISFLTDPILRWALGSYLMRGDGWPRWARFMIREWMYEDKGRAHAEYGDVFLVVSPGGIICYVGNAQVAMQVAQKRKSFIKPAEKMKMLEPFGPNVVSTEGDIWRFHIRITLPPFGEAVNRLVWDETMRQTHMLITSWAEHGSRSLKSDIYLLTVNVMSCVAFGQQAEWTDDANAIPAGHSLTLVKAIYGVVMNLPLILLIPKLILRYGPWKHVYEAYSEYEKYMNELLEEEKRRMNNGQRDDGLAKGNLLTAVLKENDSSGREKQIMKGPGGRLSLTDEEIKGNVFIFLLAGYDTTANTILYSSLILTLHPHIQDAVIAENIRIHAMARTAGRKSLCFDHDLPKFRYLLAFMYEVMRVFPIVIPIGRVTPPTTSEVLNGATLPPGTGVVINITGIHYNTTHWPSPAVIDPRRWLCSSPNAFDPNNPSAQHLAEVEAGTNTIPSHQRGSFMTFNEGPRACLGKRFAQVEFIAFFSCLLEQHTLRLAKDLDGAEVEKMLRLRAGGSPVTLTPPEDVKVYLTPHAQLNGAE